MNVVVGCIVKKEDKFLMVKEGHGRCQGMWNFPIGHLEENETIIEGAKREILEETGYEVDIHKMLPITELYQNNKKYILIRFLATPKEKIKDYESTIAEIKWMRQEEILNIPKQDFRGYESNIQVLEYLNKNNLFSTDILQIME